MLRGCSPLAKGESIESLTNAGPCRRTHTPYEEKPRFSSRLHGDTENDELYLEDREHDSARQTGAITHSGCGVGSDHSDTQTSQHEQLHVLLQQKKPVTSFRNVTFCRFHDFNNDTGSSDCSILVASFDLTYRNLNFEIRSST